MRPVLCLLSILCFHFSFAQKPSPSYPLDSVLALAADNGKHARRYTNLRTLKIRYLQDGHIVRAKGRLMIDNLHELQLIPYGHKDIVIINPDSIVRITPWHRKGKIGAAVVAGTGLAALAGVSLLTPPDRPYVTDGPATGFVLMMYAAAALWYEAIVVPAILLGEWLFVRSVKKGYHFSIVTVPARRNLLGNASGYSIAPANVVPRK